MEIKTYLKQLDPYRTQLEKAETGKANARKGSAQPERAAPQGDRISLSVEGKLRTEAYAAAQAAPDVRQEKVDTLRERVNNGSYTVDSLKVAEKLVKEEIELFRR